MTTLIRQLVIVVPARDEEKTIARCLDALEQAVARLHSARPTDGPEVRIVVVLDRCVDGTASVVARRPSVDFLAISAGKVGVARSRGIERALADSAFAPESVWIANTDADSAVPADWLCVQLEAAEAGHGVLLGAVRPDEEGLDAERLAHYLLRHPLRESHRNVHGANLGVRADHYLAGGGFAPVATGEDAALVAKLESLGVDVTSTARAAVLTSSRLLGRAPDGYAGVLRAVAG
ncbi:glycosyltransferase family A protein [Agreia sp. VKM Ac-1783]|uniref:glycosyltransferase n=1 Tax=Agreia sp. VKM Ac-1783 TaxID=1938889 RepID=UPI000A2AC8DE|nr:glycosyltransferase family A protein [Agreia sp. VKM Ac-1783]SMQ71956.1 Glycosyl transferase family 2 [Agreia sp. VKM Ac-1783]